MAALAALRDILETAAETLEGRRAELDGLDQALADGDHGRNMAEAARLLRAEAVELTALPLPEAVARLGARLRALDAGTAVRLYGVFLAGMATALPAAPERPGDLLPAVEAGLAALNREGAVPPGGKSLVDVLDAVHRALGWYAGERDLDRLSGLLLAAAGHAMHQTRYREAKWPPAADRGPRTLDHMDAGACSAALLLGAVLDGLDRARRSGRC